MGPFIASGFQRNVGLVMSDAVNAIGVQIAVYYALAAIAVTVAFRREVLKSASNAFFLGFLPLLGAAFMIFTFTQNVFGSGLSAGTKWIALGSLALGLIPMARSMAKRVPYFDRSAQLASEGALETELVQVAA